jgi:hypothetical protein
VVLVANQLVLLCKVRRNDSDVGVNRAELRLDGGLLTIARGLAVAGHQVSLVSDRGGLELLGIAIGVVLAGRVLRCDDVPVEQEPSEDQSDDHNDRHDNSEKRSEEFLHYLTFLLIYAKCVKCLSFKQTR